MYGELVGSINNYLGAGVGDRLTIIPSLAFMVTGLNNKLRLDSLYEFRLSNANPDSRSRIINFTYLWSYHIQRNFQVGL